MSIQLRVLETSGPRSDSFPEVERWTAAADHRRKGAPEQQAPVPRRHRLEDAGEWWRRCPRTGLQDFL
jgi:hypothetical protein